MEQALDIIKAMADGNRLRVVMNLASCGEMCVCQITELLNLATPTVSRHVSVLQKAGLVRSRKEGRWVYYALEEDFPVLCMKWLKSSLEDSSVLKQDQERLKTILSCDRNVLCKFQKDRQKACNEKCA